MKAENLAKLMLEKCLTKKRSIRVSDFEMLYHLIYHPKAKKRTFWWYNHGASAKDTLYNDVEVLRKRGVDYSYWNEGGKGGKNGNYLIITEKGYRRIKPFLSEVKKYTAQGCNNISVYEHLLNCITQVAYPTSL